MKRFICILLIVMLCLCAAACGEGNNNAAQAGTDAPTTADATAAPQGLDPDTKFDSVADYLSEPSMAALIAEAEAANTTDNMTARIYADGDMMVYEFKYLVKLTDDQINQMKSEINELLNSGADSFLSDLEDLKQHVNVDEPKLFVVYLASDGYEIASKLYT